MEKYISYQKKVFNRISKIIGAQNQLTITFCSDLVCNKARNPTPTRTKY